MMQPTGTSCVWLQLCAGRLCEIHKAASLFFLLRCFTLQINQKYSPDSSPPPKFCKICTIDPQLVLLCLCRHFVCGSFAIQTPLWIQISHSCRSPPSSFKNAQWNKWQRKYFGILLFSSHTVNLHDIYQILCHIHVGLSDQHSAGWLKLKAWVAAVINLCH